MIKMMIKEIWKTAVYDDEVYEDFEVSNLGRIKSLNYNHTGKERVLKPCKDTDGYFFVKLSKNRETKTCKVHRLVAFAFLPNLEGKPCINHKIQGKKGKKINMVFFDEDGSVDEKRTTIEWVTYEENNNYGSHNEKVSKANTNGKLSKRVLQFTLDGKLIREWPSVAECGRNGFDFRNVAACCLGKRKSAYGFIWKYS